MLWSWLRDGDEPWGPAYFWFNVAEGLIWFGLGFYVLIRAYRRSWREGLSPVETAYAVAFVVFGLTDLREAWICTPVLIIAKGLICATILLIRREITRRYYLSTKWI
ncbi:hypothetical protein Pan189_11620 [Stratiformator vulcanicus]|uniref:Uncharacterized protein n=2 Tax=Stratiformator vulcanicus TaxID=2527980 RepID=A0A517QYS1_9PLAN|nr:hypothetical protein Pan189_11620 [Stratiformator vulcanicus]